MVSRIIGLCSLLISHQYVLSYGNLWSENSMHNAIFDDLFNILEYIDINL